MGRRRARQLHELAKDATSVENEGQQKVRPGVEAGKVANKRLQIGQRSPLCVLDDKLTWTQDRFC